jgi:DNA invertase Pin-like site-specific DNA recombinase
MSKPLAYSYIRMSSEIQLKGDSLRRQIELSEQYAAEHELELVRNFKLHDIGVSAFKGDNIERGALGRFLEAIQAREIPTGSFLLVESLDRLSRQDITSSVSLFLDITNNGVNIATLADNQVYRAGKTDFTQLIFSIVVMARANEESEIKSSRISAAWKNKRKKIDQQVLTKTCPAWVRINSDKTGFEVIAASAQVVERIFEAAASGQGSGVITRTLNSDQVPAFGKSHGWLESYVTKILKNRAVLGEFQPHVRIDGKRVPEGPVVRGYFPRIIDEDLFLKVQAGRRERAQVGGGRRGPKQRNLFTHIVKCSYCGASMRFIDKGKGAKGGKYLRCSASVRGMDCNSASWRYDDFEKSVFSFVREFDLRAIIEDSHKRSETATVREELMIQREKLENYVTERDRVYELLIGASDESVDFLKERLDQILKDIVAIKLVTTGLDKKLNSLPNKSSMASDAEEQLSALTQLTDKADFQSRLLVATKLRELIQKIDVATEGIQPRFESVKKLAEDGVEDLEYRTRLIEVLRDSNFSGPRSNPYFTVFFHNGTSRVVIPDTTDPTSLHWQIDHDDEGVRLTGSSGLSDVLLPSRSLDRDSLTSYEE